MIINKSCHVLQLKAMHQKKERKMSKEDHEDLPSKTGHHGDKYGGQKSHKLEADQKEERKHKPHATKEGSTSSARVLID